MQDDAPRLFTRRLELIAATPALARLDADGTRDRSHDALAAALQAGVPPGWPPAMFAEDQERFLQQLEADATLVGWSYWYPVQQKPALVVGSIGFGGRPDSGGAVEIGYSMLPQFQRRGYASEAMGALIDWAFSHDEVRIVRAHTFASLPDSMRVMEKNGLSFVGQGTQPNTLRFELRRPNRGEEQ